MSQNYDMESNSLVKVRHTSSGPVESLSESLQVTQNRFARFMHGSKLTDRVNNQIIYKDLNLLSVNQLNAQIKLLDVWKSLHDETHRTRWVKRQDLLTRTGLKSSNKPDLVTNGMTRLQMNTFYNDAAFVWNKAPTSIKECKSLITAKKQINLYIKNLPI